MEAAHRPMSASTFENKKTITEARRRRTKNWHQDEVGRSRDRGLQSSRKRLQWNQREKTVILSTDKVYIAPNIADAIQITNSGVD